MCLYTWHEIRDLEIGWFDGLTWHFSWNIYSSNEICVIFSVWSIGQSTLILSSTSTKPKRWWENFQDHLSWHLVSDANRLYFTKIPMMCRNPRCCHFRPNEVPRRTEALLNSDRWAVHFPVNLGVATEKGWAHGMIQLWCMVFPRTRLQIDLSKRPSPKNSSLTYHFVGCPGSFIIGLILFILGGILLTPIIQLWTTSQVSMCGVAHMAPTTRRTPMGCWGWMRVEEADVRYLRYHKAHTFVGIPETNSLVENADGQRLSVPQVSSKVQKSCCFFWSIGQPHKDANILGESKLFQS